MYVLQSTTLEKGAIFRLQLCMKSCLLHTCLSAKCAFLMGSYWLLRTDHGEAADDSQQRKVKQEKERKGFASWWFQTYIFPLGLSPLPLP